MINKSNKINMFKVILVIIGTLIGAGFASGQEIYIFFYAYGINGILGIIICTIIMSLIIYKVLKIINKNNISTYKELINLNSKSKYINVINKLLNYIINIVFVVTFYIMIAGFGAYLNQDFGINKVYGSIIISILCFIVFRKNVNMFVKINEYIVPILIIFIFGIAVLNVSSIGNVDTFFMQNNKSGWLSSCILYSSYNLITIVPPLVTVKKYLSTNKQIKTISVISGLIIILLAFCIYTLLARIDINIATIEMPVLYAINMISNIFRKIYGFVILSAIFTTAISVGTGFLNNVAKNYSSYTHIAFFMCITAPIISQIGFSNLVSMLYPFFGYVGIIQIVRILFI